MEKEEKLLQSLSAGRIIRFTLAWLAGAVVLAWLTFPWQPVSLGILLVVTGIAWHRATIWLCPRIRRAACSVFVCVSLLLVVPPIWLRIAARGNGWVYGWDPLAPGHQPQCDVIATADELLKAPYVYASETPHWSEHEKRCDCRLPDGGPDVEVGHCARQPGSEDLPTFTVVMALVDIGRSSRSPCNYLRMLKPQLVRDYNLVLFAESWVEPFVRKMRDSLGFGNKTKIHVLTRSSKLAWYHLLAEMQAIGDRNYWIHLLTGFQSGVSQKTIANYGWINHQKIDWVVQAAEENAFGSDYFVWIDAGAGHGQVTVGKHFCACNLAVPNTVTFFHNAANTDELFEVGTHVGNKQSKRYLAQIAHWFYPDMGKEPVKDLTLERYMESFWNYHHFDEIMGTFWGGSPQGLKRLFADYNRTVYELLAHGHIDYDQTIMVLIAASKPNYLRYIGSNFHGVMHMC